ncbi:MAG: ABC transporter ATP-binding protein [Candidatus Eisenbacteria bacterium]|nr:ABC transporter ATP-binding protein [Candidatus Eisenbacteria bacterium]
MNAPTRGIELRDVTFSYQGSTKGHPTSRIDLDVPSLRLDPGLTLLLGPNGSGKSTLLKLVAGIEPPATGLVTIDGADLWTREREARLGIAYIPEQPDLSPYAAVGEVVRLVCSLRNVPWSAGQEMLEQVGLGGLEHRTVRELSQGQKRRALFASAFLGEATTLILDEPLVSLDLDMREMFLSWLRERLDRGACALLSTHELEPFTDAVNAVVSVKSGQVVKSAPPERGAGRLERLRSLARGSESVD